LPAESWLCQIPAGGGKRKKNEEGGKRGGGMIKIGKKGTLTRALLGQKKILFTSHVFVEREHRGKTGARNMRRRLKRG